LCPLLNVLNIYMKLAGYCVRKGFVEVMEEAAWSEERCAMDIRRREIETNVAMWL
jgi:hypothetical protein